MSATHDFAVSVEWAGPHATEPHALGAAARAGARRIPRASVARAEGVPELPTSAARVFHGDADRWNPEQLLIASLAQCHLLSYLYVCAREGVEVVAYRDEAAGVLAVRGESGAFAEVLLRPRVTVATADLELATRLHGEAHELCFIANSVNFPVRVEPEVRAAEGSLPG
ncbi:MAG: OsmC family protein [Actinomycetales bacterium]|nr:OsmC family protein [Actinomycetales bacterium]